MESKRLQYVQKGGGIDAKRVDGNSRNKEKYIYRGGGYGFGTNIYVDSCNTVRGAYSTVPVRVQLRIFPLPPIKGRRKKQEK